jgi:hypothetical protein
MDTELEEDIHFGGYKRSLTVKRGKVNYKVTEKL